MKLVLATVFFLVATSQGAPQTRVIGGEQVFSHDYPYLVSIQSGLFDNQQVCGGAIISPNWVITAAHCIGIPLIDARIVAGTYNLAEVENNPTVQIRFIDLYSVIKHPQYSEINNDIALIKMTEPFEFNDFVQPLLISKGSCYALDEDSTFSGWGTENGTNESPILHAANMTIIPFEECDEIVQAAYGDNLPLYKEFHICVTGEASPCIFDAGGPLVQDNRLIGLLSWLPSICLNNHVPAIFTKTSYYKDFIRSYVDDLPA